MPSLAVGPRPACSWPLEAVESPPPPVPWPSVARGSLIESTRTRSNARSARVTQWKLRRSASHRSAKLAQPGLVLVAKGGKRPERPGHAGVQDGPKLIEIVLDGGA